MSVTTRTNDLPNPSFETNTTGWAGTNCTLASSTAQAFSRTHSLAITASTAAAFSVNTPTGTSGIAVTAGTSKAFQVQARTAVTARTVTATILWYTAAGAANGSSAGTGVTDASTGWTIATVVATAPANTAFYAVQVSYNTAASSEVHYIDACLAETSTVVGSYFDGSFVNAAGVVYAWTSTADASTSTATTYAPYITLVQGTTPSPNVQVTWQDFDQQSGGDTINVWRTVDGVRRPVRGCRRINVVGSGFTTDYEAALGRSISYDIEILSGVCAGVVVTTATTTITSSASGWLSDPLAPASAIPVYADVGPNGEPGLDWDALPSWDYKATVTKLDVAGTNEPVVLVGQRQAAANIDVKVTTLATGQSNSLRTILKQAAVLLFRPLVGWASGLPGLGYIVAQDIIEAPVNEKMGGQMVGWQIKADTVTPPAAQVVVPTVTYGTVSGNYATYAAFNAAHSGQTYLAMEQSP
ncbi:hypothetical protein SPF06_01090 [Sinomonas sp. JGH33]|uniref:Fibronectin type-III domain-containing protein n=1 Tax=Sinomonas terricola TaxID=3110330 RepID=A0ABU5T296_9MICC|nr:hypothetical protein [Sinomonas sp. JGH33]MEA5453306.1 hypothetical protein [Sinomonas sp. JGH33]